MEQSYGDEIMGKKLDKFIDEILRRNWLFIAFFIIVVIKNGIMMYKEVITISYVNNRIFILLSFMGILYTEIKIFIEDKFKELKK